MSDNNCTQSEVQIIPEYEYYYGKDFDKELIRPHLGAFELKKKWARKLLDSLLEVPYYDRDFTRINKVCEAIKFNQKLIDEVTNPGVKKLNKPLKVFTISTKES